MKPYFKAFYNEIRFQMLKIGHKGLTKCGLLLLGYSTRMTFSPSSKVRLGTHILSDGRLSIVVGDHAELSIGDHTYFNEGNMISSHCGVHIGEGCQFGPDVKIFDNDHVFTPKEGVLPQVKAEAITIGDHCWIGSNVVILKGTNIGNRCVIGAGCVVKGNIPDGSLVTQNRELNIRKIEDR